MLPLDGFKVLDLTRLLPGGFATMTLADLGCEVIKIEEPTKGDLVRDVNPKIAGTGTAHFLLNRNKKSVTLNLKTEDGKKIFYELAERSDALIESFRPDVARSLGIGYETIASLNQKIVYCSVSGFGQTGSYSQRPGHDINFIALSGILGFESGRDKPPKIPPVQIADVFGGSLAVIGILAAMIEARITGKGKYVDVSLLDSAIMFSLYLIAGRSSLLNGSLARYNIYRTSDDRYLALGSLEEQFWESFCDVIKRPDLVNSNFSEDELKSEIQKEILGKSLLEWDQLFADRETCVSAVLLPEEVPDNPLIRERGIFQKEEISEGASLNLIKTPIIFKGDNIEIKSTAPKLGENTSEIISELGYSTEELVSLKKKGII